MGIPALGPTDPRMPLVMNSIAGLRISFCQYSLSLVAAVNTPIQGCSGRNSKFIGSGPCSSACVRMHLSLGKCSALHLSSTARARCHASGSSWHSARNASKYSSKALTVTTRRSLARRVDVSPTGYLRHRSAAFVDTPGSCPSGEFRRAWHCNFHLAAVAMPWLVVQLEASDHIV